MLDFTSALYLGLQHPHAALEPWDALTLGRPAVLQDPPGALQLTAELARLQGTEAATLLPSTLHLFWDLIGVLNSEPAVLLCDAGVYPIARWALAHARGLGMRVHEFPHHDAAALRRLAVLAQHERRRPIIVADGYCTGCAVSAPLAAYSDIAVRHGGYLLIDDTQALGVLGARSEAMPYGCGGGGSLRWHGIRGNHILIASSLAKAFGAPLAVLAGSRALTTHFERNSKTRIHCSPPSLAAIHAARRALSINQVQGEALRQRLMRLVQCLRRVLLGLGLTPLGSSLFPIQTFIGAHAVLERLHDTLRRRGVRALLTRLCRSAGMGLTFIVTARHAQTDIAHLRRVLAATPTSCGARRHINENFARAS